MLNYILYCVFTTKRMQTEVQYNYRRVGTKEGG